MILMCHMYVLYVLFLSRHTSLYKCRYICKCEQNPKGLPVKFDIKLKINIIIIHSLFLVLTIIYRLNAFSKV